MFRFISKSYTFFISNHHNASKIQDSTNCSLRLLQTLALNPNSNTCNSKNQHNPTVSYLINKCGLSLDSAISASKQVIITDTQKADSVLQLVKSYDFTQTHITNLITKCPSLLQSDPEATLKPKLEYFKSLGLSKPDLAKILSSNKNLWLSSLSDKIIPTVDFLKTVLTTNENLIHALERWSTISYRNYRIETEANLSTLRARGVPDLHIGKLLMTQPKVFIVRNEVFQDRVRRVEEMGIGPRTQVYCRAIGIMLSLDDSIWEERVNIYKSFGWSDEDVIAAFKKQPDIMGCLDKKIRVLMSFYLNKLGLQSSDVLKCPDLLLLSVPLCEKKINLFKSFGWLDKDFIVAFKERPDLIFCTEKRIRILMDFYLNKLGLKPSDVAESPFLLLLNLEKRIIPRCSVLQFLLSKGLISEMNFVPALKSMKEEFEKTFVTKYKEVVPEILSVYRGEKGFPKI